MDAESTIPEENHDTSALLQEVSSTVERTKEQLTVIREQLQVLEGCQGIFVKMRVYTSKVAVPMVSAPSNVLVDGAAHHSGVAGAEKSDGVNGPGMSSPEVDLQVTYEKVEKVSLLITVDRYIEVMTGEVDELQQQVEALAKERDEVNAGFNKLVAHFGERPTAVKESEWWGDLVRFLKPFSKLQAALVKSRAALKEAEERKRNRTR